jgi:hypothetical protein
MKLHQTHLQILRRIQNGSQIVRLKSPNTWRFKRGSAMYADFVLNELRQAELLSDDNQITPKGILWLLVNEKRGSK